MTVEQQTQALLALVDADRARQCQAILGEAERRAAALRRQARADALARLRQAFAEQRLRRRERIAAAQARLATQRRLQAQQHSAGLLRRAWAQLPGELQAAWQDDASRAAWVAQVVAAARDRLPPGGWHIVHAPDWPAAERLALSDALAAAPGIAPVFKADPAIRAGLKVMAQGNVIDGTLAGLLDDRVDFEAQLLRQLELAR